MLYRVTAQEDHGDFYVVRCALTAQTPDATNIQTLYDWLKTLRHLEKEFYVELDTTKSTFRYYLKYVPTIIRELSITGQSHCLGTVMIVQDSFGVVTFLNGLIHKLGRLGGNPKPVSELFSLKTK